MIGGIVWPNYTDSIIKLYVKDITNIEKYNFTTLTDTLSRERANMAAVLHKTDIYVAGGWVNEIDVIDTKTDLVMLWGKLYEVLLYVTPIVVSNRLYIFGGSTFGKAVDYWQYFDLFGAFNLYSFYL